MMEHFNAGACFMIWDPIGAIYSSGYCTGVSVCIGDGIIQITSSGGSGQIDRRCLRRVNFGGGDVTDYLSELIREEHGLNMKTSAEREIVREMKEANCYLSLDFEKECKKKASESSDLWKKFELPDGNVINMSEERFKCSEVLFNPKLINKDLPGIHELIHSSISNVDIDLRRDLYGDVVVCGGGTMVPGFKERLTKELISLA